MCTGKRLVIKFSTLKTFRGTKERSHENMNDTEDRHRTHISNGREYNIEQVGSRSSSERTSEWVRLRQSDKWKRHGSLTLTTTFLIFSLF